METFGCRAVSCSHRAGLPGRPPRSHRRALGRRRRRTFNAFGGYDRYLWGPRLWRRLRALPYPLRQALGAALRAPSPAAWDRLLGHAGVLRPGEKLHKLAHALRGARDIDGLYRNLIGDPDWAARVVPVSTRNDEGPRKGGSTIGLNAPLKQGGHALERDAATLRHPPPG